MSRFDVEKPARLIDVSVHLSRWPFSRLPHDEPELFVKKLREQNVVRALAGSFDAILHRDLGAVNERLVVECERYGSDLLTPVGSVNLALPDWESDVEFCAETPSIPAIRIYPGSHDYPLNDGRFASLLEQCAKAKLIVQIVMRLEDSRTEHLQFPSKRVDLLSVTEIMQRHPSLPIILLNSGRDVPPPVAEKLASSGNVFFDLGMIEQTGGVSRYLQRVSPERFLFGSHFPFFYFEAATLKLHENEALIGKHVIDLIAYKNAERLLAGVSS